MSFAGIEKCVLGMEVKVLYDSTLTSVPNMLVTNKDLKESRRMIQY